MTPDPRERSPLARAPRAAVPLLLVLTLVAGCADINIRLAMNRGVSHFKAGEYEQAAESFKRAIRMNPRYAEAYLDLGLTYMELYEPGSTHPKDLQYSEQAIESFKRYLRIEPDDEKVQNYLINICSVSKRMDEAIDFFREDYDRNPDDLSLVKTIAALYHKAGDTESAIEWFEKAAALEPDNPEAQYSVGVACWGRSYNSPFLEYEERMALVDKGLTALGKARELRQDYYEAITYESLLYREKAKYDISPAESVKWTQTADELLQEAMRLRTAAMEKQAAAAGDAQPASNAPASGEE